MCGGGTDGAGPAGGMQAKDWCVWPGWGVAGVGGGGWTVLPVNEEEVVEVHAEEAREDLATAGRTREAAHVRGDSVWAAS